MMYKSKRNKVKLLIFCIIMINVLVGFSIGLYFIIKYDLNKTEDYTADKNELKNRSNGKRIKNKTDSVEQESTEVLKTPLKNRKNKLDKGTQTDFDSLSSTQTNPLFLSLVKYVQDIIHDQTIVPPSQLIERYNKRNNLNKDNQTNSDESDAESRLAVPLNETNLANQTEPNDLPQEQKEKMKNYQQPKNFWNNFVFMKDFQFEQKDFDNAIAARFNDPEYEEPLKKFDIDKISNKNTTIYNFNEDNYKVKIENDAVIFESCTYEELIKNRNIYDIHIISNNYYIEFIQKKNDDKYLVVYKQLKIIDDLKLYHQIFHLINAIEYYYTNGILLTNFDHKTFDYAEKHNGTVVLFKTNKKQVHFAMNTLKDNSINIYEKYNRYWGEQINNIQQYLLGLANIIRLYALIDKNPEFKIIDFNSKDTFFYKDTNINVVKLFVALRNKKVKGITELKKIFEEKISDDEAKQLNDKYCVRAR